MNPVAGEPIGQVQGGEVQGGVPMLSLSGISRQVRLPDESILPILTVDSVAQAQSIVGALLRGGLHSIELTLRTPAALDAISA